MPRVSRAPKILIASKYPQGEGYSWRTIEERFKEITRLYISRGWGVVIAYPDTAEGFADKRENPERTVFDWYRSNPYEVYRFIRRNRIRTVYITDCPTISLKYMTARLAGVSGIMDHVRSSGVREIRPLPVRAIKFLLNRTSLFSISRAIAVSEYVKNRLVTRNLFPPKKIRVIGNFVDTKMFGVEDEGHARKTCSIAGDRKIVICGARALKYKGIQVLIESADMLINLHGRSDICFLYFGDGPDLAFFRDMVREKGLKDHFYFGGETDELHRMLSGAYVAVVPSIWEESFGRTAIEAMASGVPVVASRVGGLAEIIDDGADGFYFEKENAGRLACIIRRLADDTCLRRSMAHAARLKVMKKYSKEVLEDRFLGLFEEMSGLERHKEKRGPVTA